MKLSEYNGPRQVSGTSLLCASQIQKFASPGQDNTANEKPVAFGRRRTALTKGKNRQRIALIDISRHGYRKSPVHEV